MESKNWIGGEWITPQGEAIVVQNPSDTAQAVGQIRLSDQSHVRTAAEAAQAAFPQWAGLSGAARGEYLYSMAAVVAENSEELAKLASQEMGKPISEMRGEVTRGIHLLRYYAAEGMRANGSLIPSADRDVLQYTKRVPLGVVGVITPWNFPVAIPIWKIAPALICGNTVIWKPSEIGSLTATRLSELFAAAKLPPGVLNVVIGKGREIGSTLLEEVDLQAVSFTGSTATGRVVAESCARRNIKYQTEMGGKNAAVVLRDADLKRSIPIILSGAFRSAGQKCTATSRIIVERAIYPTFVELLQEAITSVKVGSALDPDAYLGPVASADQYEKVGGFAATARREAELVAECVTPETIKERGYYINPLVVTGLTPDHSLVQEEVFGPLAVVLPADDFAEAIELCNRSVYGLSASLFTQDLSRAFQFLEQAEAGMVRVNQETAGVEYQAPFGGMKQSSSHSREQGQAALDFYSEIKTCAIKHSF
ncbi:aldehyde dehydrogenase family protein [Brevibacillus humidisoli]|uniref:aldehyde dehydrogenase family protein n=1 Tax=Brevibacillus humidisoli TaxID=2895522 RepID=UPI001E3C033C|nr:aldehyde dehydrogenase family protein [Brevibacillus humidisoli]UFJ39555.1 aldehyde dehydrogenase family protein [Brevibacillus humidisoli]